MSRRRRVTIIVAAVFGIVATPLVWLVGSPEIGQLVGASAQVAVCIVAFVWALFKRSKSAEVVGVVADSGRARAIRGGYANTGVRRPGGVSGSVRAERTGDASADGLGSSTNTGIDFT